MQLVGELIGRAGKYRCVNGESRFPPTLMFAPALAAVPGQPSTDTQCAIDDFLGTLQLTIGPRGGRCFA